MQSSIRHIHSLLDIADPLFRDWADRLHRCGCPETLLFESLRNRLRELPPASHTARPPGTSDFEAAENLHRGRISLLGLPPVRIGFPVDWRAHYGAETQWTAHLGYFYGFNALTRAWRETGDSRHARLWLDIVDDFIDRVPYGDPALTWFPSRPMCLNDRQSCDNGENDHQSPCLWISLACHMRTDAWLDGLRDLADCPLLTPERFARILHSMYGDHFLCLVNNPRENTPNQFISTSSTLLRLGLAFPGLRNASAAFLIGMERLERAVRNVMFPDGSDLEQSPNYNAGLLPRLCDVLHLLDRSGAPHSRGEFLRDALRRRAGFLIEMLAPDGRMVDLAKAHAATSTRESVFACLPDPPPPPPGLHTIFPWGGYATFRGGRGPDDDYLLFKFSRLGVGHAHEDALSLVLHARGRRLLVDSGSFSYSDLTPRERGMNAYLHSSHAHSTLCVDGHGQARRGLLEKAHPDRRICDIPPFRAGDMPPIETPQGRVGPFVFVEGCYGDGYGPDRSIRAIHRRGVIRVEDFGWCVLDRIDPRGSRRFTLNWMLAPECLPQDVRIREHTGLLAVEAGFPGLQLQLYTLVPGAAQAEIVCGRENPWAGWYGSEYAVAEPKPDLRIHWEGGSPHTVVTWISICEGGRRNPVMEQIENGLLLRRGTDTLSIKPSALEQGEWCLIRGNFRLRMRENHPPLAEDGLGAPHNIVPLEGPEPSVESPILRSTLDFHNQSPW